MIYWLRVNPVANLPGVVVKGWNPSVNNRKQDHNLVIRFKLELIQVKRRLLINDSHTLLKCAFQFTYTSYVRCNTGLVASHAVHVPAMHDKT